MYYVSGEIVYTFKDCMIRVLSFFQSLQYNSNVSGYTFVDKKYKWAKWEEYNDLKRQVTKHLSISFSQISHCFEHV